MADILYFIRHAAPPADKRGRYWGRADPGVMPEALGALPDLKPLFWHRPERLTTSPLPRTMATAGRLASLFSLVPEAWDDLAEADFGLFDGLTYAEIAARHPTAAAKWARKGDAFAFPGGEAIPHFLRRVEVIWRRLTALPETAVAVVTHAGVIATLACLFFGLPAGRRFTFRQDYGAVSAFVRKKDGSGWVLRYFNHGA